MKNSSFNAKCRFEGGFSLIFAIFLTVALMLVAGSLTALIFNLLSSYDQAADHQKAYYLAEAAVEYGKSRLTADPNWNTPGTTINTPTGSIVVIKSPGKDRIIGEGRAGATRVIINADVIGNNTYIQREE